MGRLVRLLSLPRFRSKHAERRSRASRNSRVRSPVFNRPWRGGVQLLLEPYGEPPGLRVINSFHSISAITLGRS